MTNKISAMLDAVADSLEKKGLKKEAHEIDKVADYIEATDTTSNQGNMPYDELKKIEKELEDRLNEIKKVTSTEYTGDFINLRMLLPELTQLERDLVVLRETIAKILQRSQQGSGWDPKVEEFFRRQKVI